MVKTLEQAKRIQAKRVAAGKPGFSKAVYRFLRRTGTQADCSMPYIPVA